MEVATPAITRNEDGSFLVAWIDREGRRRVVVQHLSSSLDPIDGRTPFGPEEGMPMNPSIAACGGGAWLAWQHQEPGGNHSIRLTRWDRAGSSGSGRVAGRGEHPVVSCLGGRGALTWTSRHDGIRDVLLRWAEPGGQLGDRILLSVDTEAAHDPDIACSSERCGVVWSDRRAIYADVYATFIDGHQVEPPTPTRVSIHDQTNAGAGGAYAPTLATTDDERFLVAWYDTRNGSESEIYVAPLNTRGRAGSPHRVSRSPAPSTAAVISRCGEGDAVAWTDRRAGPPSVVFAALDERGRRRSAAMMLSHSQIESSSPAMTCSRNGSFAIAWTEAQRPENSLHLVLVSCR